jgi:hypothetical protein
MHIYVVESVGVGVDKEAFNMHICIIVYGIIVYSI